MIHTPLTGLSSNKLVRESKGKTLSINKWHHFIYLYRKDSNSTRTKKTVEVIPTEKLIPYSTVSPNMKQLLQDHPPSISASKSLHTLNHESYRRLDPPETTPTSTDSQSQSMFDLRSPSYHEHIERIRKDISQFSRPLTLETPADIPKASSRWSKFMTPDEESGDEVLKDGHCLLQDSSTVAQFALTK